MKYCVFVFGAILACCCAQAHVRYDFSMGPIGSEKMFLRGLHSDFYVMPWGNARRLSWLPSSDCLLESSAPVTNRIWGVSTIAALNSISCASNGCDLRYGIRVYTKYLTTDSWVTNMTSRIPDGVEHNVFRTERIVSFCLGDRERPDEVGVPKFIEQADILVRQRHPAAIMCSAGIMCDLLHSNSVQKASFAVYVDSEGNLTVAYSNEAKQVIYLKDFKYEKGALYGSVGNEINMNHPVAELKDDLSEASVAFHVFHTRSSQIRLLLKNIDGIIRCLQQRSAGEGFVWTADSTPNDGDNLAF